MGNFWKRFVNNPYDDNSDEYNDSAAYDEGDGYEEEEEEDDSDAYENVPRQAEPAPAPRRQTYAAQPRAEAESSNRVLNIHATAQLQVVIRRPQTLEDAREIADHLMERRTVVVNLDSINRDIGRRILDFLGGVSYATRGDMSKVANATFVITPHNVNVIGQDVLNEVENNGVFFG